MQDYASFRQMLESAIRRSAGQWRETATRHGRRSRALVIGTALGLVLAGAPPVVRSAQTDNQLSIDTGDVISEITVNAITQRTCAGPLCMCPAGQIVTGGGAQCVGMDTLQQSIPFGDPATSWRASCVRLMERRLREMVLGGQNALITANPIVEDIQRFTIPPATTHVICATP